MVFGGDVIGLGLTNDPYFSPVAALRRRIKHFQTHDTPSTIPLVSYFQSGRWQHVTSSQITTVLPAKVATFPATELGFLPSDISARSLLTAVTMALLDAKVDTDIIQLIGVPPTKCSGICTFKQNPSGATSPNA
eukprot:CAMPEP_0178896340 /NCGR_PEP_ID=MMETSP0786-20121207/1109_1 /TAXON_ID=186022 /ORGANISM="Thalassionema frauenfeldii, Strain CCMP 1798" /LENGTH=133 /DNA_ID=CAMNT_0020566713 /DNA_START=830 /DNA_END=1231 /DNA_ORIENTATION=+